MHAYTIHVGIHSKCFNSVSSLVEGNKGQFVNGTYFSGPSFQNLYLLVLLTEKTA